jgi:predicted O-methyltransferase YrrM
MWNQSAKRLSQLRRAWTVGGLSLVFGRTLRNAGDELIALSAPRTFEIATETVHDLDQAVEFAVGSQFSHYGVDVGANQKQTEIRTLLETLTLDPPRRVVEIGTSRGGTLWLFTRIAASDAVLISIDLPGNGILWGYPARHRRLYRSFARERQHVELLRFDSHSSEALRAVRRSVGDAIDFLFIDGDHSYEGVKHDFELYGALVRQGGLIAFHDIVPGREALVGGVPRFWAELKAETDAHTEEYVADWSQGGWGIGVIRVPDHPIARGSSDP